MRRHVIVVIVFIIPIVLFNCKKNDATRGNTASLGSLPLAVSSTVDNQSSSQKIELGRLLFWDPVLSGSKDVACASCHHASLGYTDNLDLAIGTNASGIGTSRHFNFPNDIKFSKRNTPTIINVGFNGMDANGNYDPTKAAMFFDNRVNSLELQCVQPVQTMEEMMGHKLTQATVLDSVVSRLKAIPAYVQLFNNSFGANSVSITNVSKAIASFERSIVSNNAPYDRYVRGETGALNNAQLQGMRAFQQNGCNKCHSGPMFSDYQLHVLSVPDNNKLPTDGGASGSYAFRTPSLRNLALTAPYMHSGVFNSLTQVLDFYEQVGRGRSQNSHVSSAQLDPKLQGIGDNDKATIIQFLQSLNDNSFDRKIPTAVPSNLRPGGN